jgi:hypothetical protein
MQSDDHPKHEPRIRPVFIELPLPEPPMHLRRRFHFNSKWLALRTGKIICFSQQERADKPDRWRNLLIPVIAAIE